MPRAPKYTAETLELAVSKYFRSISRTRVLTEDKATGELDKYGHQILAPVDVLDDDGEPVRVTEFVRPPTVAGLCRYLCIHRSTWADYCDPGMYPEFAEITEWARDMLRGYLEDEMLLREGKNIQGVAFTLKTSYGVSETTTVELGPRAARAAVSGAAAVPLSEREALLAEIAREFGGIGHGEP